MTIARTEHPDVPPPTSSDRAATPTMHPRRVNADSPSPALASVQLQRDDATGPTIVVNNDSVGWHRVGSSTAMVAKIAAELCSRQAHSGPYRSRTHGTPSRRRSILATPPSESSDSVGSGPISASIARRQNWFASLPVNGTDNGDAITRCEPLFRRLGRGDPSCGA